MAFERTTAWDRAARDERTVRRGFWPKATRVAGKLPFSENLLAAYYCAFDRATPFEIKVALVGALAYFVLPVDAVPDLIPMLGYADDAALLAGVIKLVSGSILPEHREAARRALARQKE